MTKTELTPRIQLIKQEVQQVEGDLATLEIFDWSDQNESFSQLVVQISQLRLEILEIITELEPQLFILNEVDVVVAQALTDTNTILGRINQLVDDMGLPEQQETMADFLGESEDTTSSISDLLDQLYAALETIQYFEEDEDLLRKAHEYPQRIIDEGRKIIAMYSGTIDEVEELSTLLRSMLQNGFSKAEQADILNGLDRLILIKRSFTMALDRVRKLIRSAEQLQQPDDSDDSEDGEEYV